MPRTTVIHSHERGIPGANGLVSEVEVEAIVDAAIAAAGSGFANVFDVTDPAYGAVGNGSTNDRAAIQAAIDAAEAAGGGIVWFPEGVYKVQISTATTDTSPVSDGQHCLRIDGNNITLRGAPGAVLDCFPLNGDPDTNWEVVSGAVWRGGGIFISGGANWAARRRNVRIEGLEIDGNYSYTGDHTFPANTGTGDGWDVTHKGIWYENDTYHDNHAVVDCAVHNFSGEVIYSGGADNGATPVLGDFDVIHCQVYESNASIVSMSGRRVRVSQCEIYTTAGHGIENGTRDGQHEFAGNEIYDTDLAGISAVGYSEGFGGFNIHDNDIHDCLVAGIGLYSAWNTQAHHNRIRDTVWGIRMEVASGYPNDWMQDVDVFDNIIWCHAASMSGGILCGFDPGQALRIRVHRNDISRTKAAETAGYIISEPMADYPTTDHDELDSFNNSYLGTHGTSAAFKAFNQLLTGTGEVVPVLRKHPIDAMLSVSISVRVITAATNVTITITYQDVTDTTVTVIVLPITSLAVGSYTYPTYMVPTVQRGETRVRITAGTANQVYVSAMIREA